jgi:hypothetical protein
MGQNSPLGDNFALGSQSLLMGAKLRMGLRMMLDWENAILNSLFFSPIPTEMKPGVDVMITIFCDFRQFSAKNWRFSPKLMLL